jgi:GNAT superfamily N-acetyltransferase
MIQRVTRLNEVEAVQVIGLGEKFYGLTGLNGTFHGDTFVDFWNGFLDRGYAAMWVYKEREIVLGTIGMTIEMSLFDGCVVADEKFWFVDPHHRGTAGIRLFMEMKDWAKNSGARRIKMGRMLAIDPENDRIGKFYERHGFRPLQTEYILDI